MSSEPGIGLTSEQATQLMKIRSEYKSKIGNSVSDPNVWFGNQIRNYLSALCVGAQGGKLRFGGPSAELRKAALLAFKSHLGRQAKAEDLIIELSRFVTVPEFLTEAIRRDMLLLSDPGTGHIS